MDKLAAHSFFDEEGNLNQAGLDNLYAVSLDSIFSINAAISPSSLLTSEEKVEVVERNVTHLEQVKKIFKEDSAKVQELDSGISTGKEFLSQN